MSANSTLYPQNFAEDMRIKVLELALPHESSDCADRITISIGGATLIASLEIDKKMLLDVADKQLYLSKNKGRNQVTSINMSISE